MRRVVITGMGTVNPIGNSAEEFKEALFAGKNGISLITRFDTSELKHKVAGEVKGFDAAAVIGKMTARKTDLFTQYALAAAKEAMTQSGIAGTLESDRIGVCFGSGIGGIETLVQDHKNLLEKGERKVSPHFVPKMIYNIAAGNIAIEYGANGPCTAVSTACATGTTAIGEGYRTILHGYADAMICGGSEAAITPLTLAGFGRHCLTPTIPKRHVPPLTSAGAALSWRRGQVYWCLRNMSMLLQEAQRSLRKLSATALPAMHTMSLRLIRRQSMWQRRSSMPARRELTSQRSM